MGVFYLTVKRLTLGFLCDSASRMRYALGDAISFPDTCLAAGSSQKVRQYLSMLFDSLIRHGVQPGQLPALLLRGENQRCRAS